MIKIIAGKNGAGKSYTGVKEVVDALKRGRLVFSDMPIYVEHKNKVLKTAKLTKQMFTDFEFPEDCLLLVNEGDEWFNSRAFKTFTADELVVFSQSRHINIDLIVIAKRFGGLDLNIRSCCDAFIWSTRFPKTNMIRPLFFKQTIYDAEEDFNSLVPKVPPTNRFLFFSKSVAGCYDTHYQRNILKKRPVKTFEWWDDESYIPKKRFFKKLFKRNEELLCRESFIDNECEHDIISHGEHIDA